MAITVFTADTIETLDPLVGRVQALAVEDGRIIAHGDDALRYRDNDAEHVQLGTFAMPSFIDAHNHHAMAGQIDLFEFEVSPTASLPEVIDALAGYVRDGTGRTDGDAAASSAEWIVGGSWGSGLLEALQEPGVREQIDAVCAGRPLRLRDDSQHNRYANSEALRRAEITAQTPDPGGGAILRTNGQPNGVLLESAGILVERALHRDEPQWAQRLEASSARAIELLHAHGVTGFQDAGSSLPLLRALHAMDARGHLRAWVVTSMLANDFIFGVEELGEAIIAHREATASRHHRPQFIKIFLDGVPPSRTGAFLEPYLPDACGHVGSGEPTMSLEELTDWMRRCAQRGIGAKIHCTGDASVHMVLDAATTLRAEGHHTARWHVAHGQFVAPDDVARFAALDVTAEISPNLCFPGVIPQAIASVLPAERARRMAPNRDLLDAGARVVGGSDWPVSPTPEVFGAIYALVTRRDPSGEFSGELWPEQAITVDEALRAYTVDAARAVGLEDVTGSLGIGKSADFITLDEDPWAVSAHALRSMQPTSTWFEGQAVYRA